MLLHMKCSMEHSRSHDPLLFAGSSQSLISQAESHHGLSASNSFDTETSRNNSTTRYDHKRYDMINSKEPIPEYFDPERVPEGVSGVSDGTEEQRRNSNGLWGANKCNIHVDERNGSSDEDYEPTRDPFQGYETLLPKSVSMPFHTETPDPFPELASFGSVQSESRTQEASKSSPSSPLVRHRGSVGAGQTNLAASQDSLDKCQKERMWTPKVFTKILVNIHSDSDTSWRTVSLDEHMRAADICHLLVIKYHALPDKNWVITEQIPKFGLERSLEDHEFVSHIHQLWSTSSHDNRFVFRKDCLKYEVFKNPNQFFPQSMVDIKMADADGSFMSRFERYKSLLLQNLFYSERMPDIQGPLLVKEGRKSWLWRKHFFVLRGSGLYYSTKGSSKDPQHLVLFSSLDDVNIYTTRNAKKTHGAPKPHCFCLKGSENVSDIKDLRLLCAEDEQTRLCWITALRLVKYGSQLRENYHSAVRYEEKLQNTEDKDGLIGGKDSCDVKSRVAMDFTGSGGRVVADPNEALGVALEEALHWRRKVTARTPTSHSPVSGSPKPGGGFLSDNPHCPRAALTSPSLQKTQPWFHSGISRQQAVDLVARQGLVDGVFLVRDSHSVKGAFVISLAHNQKVKHCQIIQVERDGQLFFTLDGGHTKFADLLQLVEFYQLNAGGLPTTLSHYVTRLV